MSTTKTTQEPGLLRTSQGRGQKQEKIPKPSKVTTTVRLDSDLKRRAEEFARSNHMDFTTFLSFSLRNTMKYGGKMEPEVSDAQYAYYSDMLHDIESGKIATEKFDTLEALRSSYR